MKTQEQTKMEVANYLEKTSLHLFEYDGNLLKVIPFTENEIMYYAMVTIKKTGEFNIRIVEPFKYQIWDNFLCSLKHSIFPEYRKTKSIKHFKKFRSAMSYIQSSIKPDKAKNDELLEKLLKANLLDLTRPVIS